MSENVKPQYQYNAPTAGAKPPRRVRLYAVMRVIDNRIQFLAPSDPEDDASEPEWTDLGGESCVWEEREEAFQIGRRLQGLLVSVEGVPGGRRTLAFHSKVSEIRKRLEEAGNEEADASVRTGGESPEGGGHTSQLAGVTERVAAAKAARAKSKAAPAEPADDLPY